MNTAVGAALETRSLLGTGRRRHRPGLTGGSGCGSAGRGKEARQQRVRQGRSGWWRRWLVPAAVVDMVAQGSRDAGPAGAWL